MARSTTCWHKSTSLHRRPLHRLPLHRCRGACGHALRVGAARFDLGVRPLRAHRTRAVRHRRCDEQQGHYGEPQGTSEPGLSEADETGRSAWLTQMRMVLQMLIGVSAVSRVVWVCLLKCDLFFWHFTARKNLNYFGHNHVARVSDPLLVLLDECTFG